MTATIRRFPLSDHQADTVLSNPDLGWDPGTLDEARALRDARRKMHPRDWLDAHADYAMTGDPAYRAERIQHERDDVPDEMQRVQAQLVASIRAAGWKRIAKVVAVSVGVVLTVLYGAWITAWLMVLAWGIVT